MDGEEDVISQVMHKQMQIMSFFSGAILACASRSM